MRDRLLKLRRQQMRRPLPMRVFALFMAVVMVISVITVTNPRSAVKAANTVDSITDESYIGGIMPSVFAKETKAIHVPAEGVVFKLPEYTTISEDVTIYSNGATDDTLDYSLVNEGEYTTSVPATCNTSYKWMSGETAVSSITSSTGTVSATLYAYVEYMVGSDVITNLTETYDYETIELVSEPVGEFLNATSRTEGGIQTIVYNDISTRKVVVGEDKNIKDRKDNASSTTDYYYGEVSFEYSTYNAKTVEELQSILNSANDGTVTIYKNITIDIGGTEKKLVRTSFEFEKRTTRCLISYSANGIAGANDIINLGNVNPTEDILVTFVTDCSLKGEQAHFEYSTSYTNFNIIDDSKEFDVSVDETTGFYTHQFKLSKRTDSSKDYASGTITVSDGIITNSFEIQINYGNGPLSVSDEAFSGGYTSDNVTYYFNTSTATINATAEVSDTTSDPRAKVKSARVYSTDSAGTPIKDSEDAYIYSEATGITGESDTENLSISTPAMTANQVSYFVVEADSTYGNSAKGNAILQGYYDTAAPTITDISYSQTALHTTYQDSVEPVEGAATFAKKASRISNLSLSVIADDASGSGISKVCLLNTEVDPAVESPFTNDSGEYKLAGVEIPATATTSANYTCRVYDNVGNYKDYSIVIPLIDETVTVTKNTEPNEDGTSTVDVVLRDDSANTKYDVFGDNFLDWKLTDSTIDNTSMVFLFYVKHDKDLGIYSATYKTASTDSGTDIMVTTEGTADADGMKTDLYRVVVPTGTSDATVTVSLSVVSDNSNTPVTATYTTYKLDMTKPTESTVLVNSAAIDESKWYSKLVLNIDELKYDATISDESAVSSGIASVTEVTGLTDNTITPDTDGKFTSEVKESESESGTTVSYKVTDNVGNSETFTHVIKVDNTNPLVNLSIDADIDSDDDVDVSTHENSNANVYLTGDAKFTCSVKDGETGSGFSGLVLDADNKVDATYTKATINGTTVPFDTEKSLSDYGVVENGAQFAIVIIGKDNAGNTISVTRTVIIDDEPPKNNMTIGSGSAPKMTNYPRQYTNKTTGDIFGTTNEDYTYGQVYEGSVNIKFAVSDSNFSKANVYDDAASTTEPVYTFTKASSYNSVTGFYEGEYTITGYGHHEIRIVSEDESGNATDDSESAKKLIFDIDNTNPTADFYLNGSKYSSSNSFVHDATIRLDVIDDYADSNDITIKVTKPDGITVTYTDENEYSFTAEGKYEVSYTAKDKAGRGVSGSCGFTVDKTEPSITVAPSPTTPPTKGINYYYNSDIAVNLTVKDVNNDTSTFKVTDTVTGDTYSPSWSSSGEEYTATITIPSSQEGSHRIKVEAVDKAGNPASGESVQMIIDTTSPVLTTSLDDATYSVTSSDNEDYKYAEGSATVGVSVSDTNDDHSDMTADITRTIPGGGTTTDQKTGDSAYSFTVSDDGAYTVKFSYKDKAGNPASATIAFTVDNGKPVNNIHVTSGSAPKQSKYYNTYSNVVNRFTYENYTYGQYFSDDVTLDVSAFDYNIDSAYVTDNGEKVTDLIVSGNFASNSITIKNEGKHEIKVISKDKSGNESSDSGSALVTFTIDRTKPSLTTYLNGLAYSELNTYIGSDCSTSVGVSDTNEDADDVGVSITKTPPGGSASTTTGVGKGDYIMSGDGTYQVTYTATDRAGNTSTASFGVTIDKTAPVTNLYVTTANPSKVGTYSYDYSNVVNRFYTFSDQEEYTYGQYYNSDVTVDLGYYDYNVDQIYVTDNGQEITPTWVSSTPLGHATAVISGDGAHDIAIYVSDLAGNESPDYTALSKRVYFTIDTVRPTITASVNNVVDAGAMRYLNESASVNVYVTDTNKDASDLYKTVRMTPPGSGVSTTSEYIAEGTETFTQEADYEITYVATDLAGNVSDTKTVQFRVDRTAPNLSISQVSGDTATSNTVSISINMVESFYSDMVTANVKIYKKKDGQPESLEANIDLNPTSANYSYPYTFTDDAEYRIEFVAEDKCGNKSETKYTFIKDGNAPLIVLSGVGNYDLTDGEVELLITVTEAFYLSNKVTLSGTRTDIDGVTHTIDFEAFPSTSGVTTELKHMFSEDGIYDISVTSTDKAGNTTTSTVHFTIDTTDPEIGDLSKYDGAKFNKFVWDIDVDELVKDLTVCDVKVYIDGVEYDGLSELEDGSHTLRVVAVDELGHSAEKEVTFVLDTILPNIIVTNVEEGDNLLEATDITVSVQIDEDTLDWVKLNGETITVSDNQAKFNVNSKGKYTITAAASDPAGNEASIELNFTFGKTTNWLLIICAGGILLLLLLAIIILIAKRRRDNYR